jgi:minichromosome maintenance protein 10
MDHDIQSWERGGSRAEKHQKRLAEKEKERELAKRLGDTGSGAGGDYMQLKGCGAQNLPARGDFRAQETDAQKQKRKEALDDPLGLIGKKAEDVSLAPVKRKRMFSGKTEAFSAPVGWGGAFKPGVPGPPKSPTKQSSFFNRTRDPSPVKKKARLLLPDKGIREPGRESLGLDVGLLAAMDEDEDDDLEVI